MATYKRPRNRYGEDEEIIRPLPLPNVNTNRATSANPTTNTPKPTNSPAKSEEQKRGFGRRFVGYMTKIHGSGDSPLRISNRTTNARSAELASKPWPTVSQSVASYKAQEAQKNAEIQHLATQAGKVSPVGRSEDLGGRLEGIQARRVSLPIAPKPSENKPLRMYDIDAADNALRSLQGRPSVEEERKPADIGQIEASIGNTQTVDDGKRTVFYNLAIGDLRRKYASATDDELKALAVASATRNPNVQMQYYNELRRRVAERESEAEKALLASDKISGLQKAGIRGANAVQGMARGIIGGQKALLESLDNSAAEQLGKKPTYGGGSIGSQMLAESELDKSVTTEGANKAVKFVADASMSLAQNLVLMPLGAPVAAGILASSAAGQTANEARQRGATPAQALGTGVLSGAAEYVGERISFGALDNIIKGAAANTIKGRIAQVLGQMTTEFGEESATEIMNIISDRIVMGDKSNYTALVNEYKAANPNATEAEAAQSALIALAGQVLYAGGMGAFSGAGTGTVAQIAGAGKYNNTTMPSSDTVYDGQTQNNDADFTAEIKADKQARLVTGIPQYIPQSGPSNEQQYRNGFLQNAYSDLQKAQEARLLQKGSMPEQTAQAAPQIEPVAAPIQSYALPTGESFLYAKTPTEQWKIEAAKAQSEIATLALPPHQEAAILNAYEQAFTEKTRQAKNKKPPVAKGEPVALPTKPPVVEEQLTLTSFLEKASQGIQPEARILAKEINKQAALLEEQTQAIQPQAQPAVAPTMLPQEQAIPAEAPPQAKAPIEVLEDIMRTYESGNNDGKFLKENKAFIVENGFTPAEVWGAWEKVHPDFVSAAKSLKGAYKRDDAAETDRIVREILGVGVDGTLAPTDDLDTDIEFLSKAAEAARQKRAKAEGAKEATPLPIPKKKDRSLKDAVKIMPEFTPFEPAVTPEAQARTNALFEKAIDQNGAIPAGENPVRDANLPNELNGKKVGQYAGTIIEARATPDEMVSHLREFVRKGYASHDVTTDNEALNYAIKEITTKGFAQATDDFINNDGIRSKFDLALGQMLYSEAAAVGDVATAMKIASLLVIEATHSGQNLQATQLLKKMTPEGRLYYATKAVEQLKSDIGTNGLEIDTTLAENLLNAKTQEEIDSAVTAIHKDIAMKLPTHWKSQLQNFRYMAMLLNPATHVRNTLGNIIKMPARAIKNIIGAGLENAAGVETKTKAILLPTKADKTLREFAKKDYAEIKSAFEGTDKYTDRTKIEQMMTPFKVNGAWGQDGGLAGLARKALDAVAKGLSKGNEFNTWLLNAEDLLFTKPAYSDSLAQYMKSNHYTPETITDEQLYAARVYAIEEGKKATYREMNKLASAIAKIERNGGIPTKLLIGGSLPFKRTPMNIVNQAFNYSPAQIAKSFTTDLYLLKHGYKGKKGTTTITANEWIDRLAQGLSGTAIVGLGYALAQMGFLGGGRDEDEKVQAYNEMLGEQPYALRFPFGTYTIGWGGPTATAMLVGAAVYDSFGEGKRPTAERMFDALTTISEPLFDTTMLQGVNSAIKAAGYSSENPVTAIAANSATNFVSQFVPTVLGTVARTVDDTRRSTYTDKTGMSGQLDRSLQRIENRLPLFSPKNEPFVDLWGRESENVGGNVAGRLAYNMLSPGYFSQGRRTEADDVIYSVYGITGDPSILPPAFSKSIEVDGVTSRFTPEQYTQYAKSAGQTANETISYFNNDYFNNLTGQEQANLISAAYDATKRLARLGIDPNYKTDKWVQTTVKLAEASNVPLPAMLAQIILVRDTLNGVSNATLPPQFKTLKDARLDALIQMGYSPEAALQVYQLYT